MCRCLKRFKVREGQILALDEQPLTTAKIIKRLTATKQ